MTMFEEFIAIDKARKERLFNSTITERYYREAAEGLCTLMEILHLVTESEMTKERLELMERRWKNYERENDGSLSLFMDNLFDEFEYTHEKMQDKDFRQWFVDTAVVAYFEGVPSLHIVVHLYDLIKEQYGITCPMP